MYLVTGASGFWPRRAPRAKITPPPRPEAVAFAHIMHAIHW